MIEIFKTNVHCDHQAASILAHIKERFPQYQANFDLDDCDCILRIFCLDQKIEHASIVLMIQNHGYIAEILPDDIPSGSGILIRLADISR